MAAEAVRHENIVVLRTLSKAFALAGARCGVVVGGAELIALLGRVLPPYSFSTPVTERVLDAMNDEGMEKAAALVRRTVDERERLAQALTNCKVIEKLWPSAANFLLVRLTDADNVFAELRARRILIREFSNRPELADCARITVGTPAENDLLIAALQAM